MIVSIRFVVVSVSMTILMTMPLRMIVLMIVRLSGQQL
jgi:hypothetical protein